MHGNNWKLSDVEVDVQGYPAKPSGGRNKGAGSGSSTEDDVVTDLDGGGWLASLLVSYRLCALVFCMCIVGV